MSDFQVFSWRGRVVLATPIQPRWLKAAGLGQYRAHTWRRKAWKALLKASLGCRAEGLLSQRITEEDLLGSMWGACSPRIADHLGDNQVQAAFLFPSQSDRGRVYVLLFDAARHPLAFAKIASRQGRPDLLRAEAQALTEISRIPERTYRVPGLIARERVGAFELLLSEPLPASARPLPCQDQARPDFRIAQAWRRVAPDAFESLSWWSALQDELTPEHRAFADALNVYRAVGLDVGRAHGDLTPGNIVVHRGAHWIYDWEQSQPDAPRSTDEVGFFLGCRARQAAVSPGS